MKREVQIRTAPREANLGTDGKITLDFLKIRSGRGSCRYYQYPYIHPMSNLLIGK